MQSSGEITKKTNPYNITKQINAHTEPLLRQLELLKLSDLLEWIALKFYFKYLHVSLPRFFYSFNIATKVHNTRTTHVSAINLEQKGPELILLTREFVYFS